MKSDNEIFADFQPLWDDIKTKDSFPEKRPFLAHYTSMATLENIMANDELWFSNPLYMNDMEELRFGIREGVQAFRHNEKIKSACENGRRYEALCDAFERKVDQFSVEHAFDTYVFCLSEHDIDDTDGLLSMWRGYGSNGNGAAIIFDTSKLNYNDGSPLVIAHVTYASQEKRRQWFNEKFDSFANLLSTEDIPTEKFHLPVHRLFERIKLFSLFTKHRGFSEEKEWRAVYLRDRDIHKKMDHMLHYAVGRQGIEPKLKYKVEPIEGLTADDLSFEKIVYQIILGPSVSSPLAIRSVQRMFEKLGKPQLSEKIIASSTPFRSL